jgi:hypothetical protein
MEKGSSPCSHKLATGMTTIDDTTILQHGVYLGTQQ